MIGGREASDGIVSVETIDGVDDGTTFSQILGSPRSPDPDFPGNASSTAVVGQRLVHVTGERYDVNGGEPMWWHSASWVQDGQTVRVSAPMGVAELLALVGTVRRATRDEWLQLNEDAYNFSTEGRGYIDPMRGPRVGLGRVELDDTTWVSVDINQTATAADIALRSKEGSTSSWYDWSNDPAEPVTEFSSSALTVLLIALPAPPLGTKVRVTVGQRSKLIALTPVGDSGVVAAFDAFVELTPYTVELIDSGGNVVSQLSSPAPPPPPPPPPPPSG